MTADTEKVLNDYFFIAGYSSDDIKRFFKDNTERLNELTLPPVICYVLFVDDEEIGTEYSTLEKARAAISDAHAHGSAADLCIDLDIDTNDLISGLNNETIAMECIYSDALNINEIIVN